MRQVGWYDLLLASLLPLLLVGSLCSLANRVMIQLLVKGQSFLHHYTCTKLVSCTTQGRNRKDWKQFEYRG